MHLTDVNTEIMASRIIQVRKPGNLCSPARLFGRPHCRPPRGAGECVQLARVYESGTPAAHLCRCNVEEAQGERQPPSLAVTETKEGERGVKQKKEHHSSRNV